TDTFLAGGPASPARTRPSVGFPHQDALRMLSGRATETVQPLPYGGGSRLEEAERALSRIPVAVWLVGMVAVSSMFRFWLARSSPTPRINADRVHIASRGSGRATTEH